VASRWQSKVASFLRLWLVLLFGYLGLRFALNLLLLGAIDLRRAFFIELLTIPLGQSVVFWVVTRRARSEQNDTGRQPR
jgi:hypothetical protein